MWLLPTLPAIARVAAGTYYRLRIMGERVPRGGPCLVVANHPNSLLDPGLVMAAAGRPIRFLAKAPLFTDPLVGWLVRAAGAIPVYRREDGGALLERNGDAFAAAHAALVGGSAIGIFPEGTSHDEPSLAPLRTGAARIALGAAALTGEAFPIVPVGLVFRDKQTFRSEARLVVGRAVSWADLAPAGQDADAVRALTGRIEDALRSVTLNLERWEDAPLIETAEAIWAAETGARGAGEIGSVLRAAHSSASPGEAAAAHGAADLARLQRLRLGTARLAELRRSGDEGWAALAERVLRHGRVLARLGLTPVTLHGDPDVGSAARWTLARLPTAGLVASGTAFLGAALFWVPYRATGLVSDALRPTPDTRSTTKLLTGIPLYSVWLLLCSLFIGYLYGAVWGIGAAVLLPLFGIATLRARERWRESRRDVRRFLLKRSRPEVVAELRGRQRRLAEEIEALVTPVEATG